MDFSDIRIGDKVILKIHGEYPEYFDESAVYTVTQLHDETEMFSIDAYGDLGFFPSEIVEIVWHKSSTPSIGDDGFDELLSFLCI